MIEHISVLKKETIDLLEIKKNGIYVDGTLGRCGHTLEILKKLDKGHLYCFDLDLEAIEKGHQILQEYKGKYTIIHDNYKNMDSYIEKVDGIILDLGVSSPQFDNAERGFSYRYNSRLDMRMNSETKLSAYEIVNNYDLNSLNRIFKEYGEEKNSYKIASKIIEARKLKPIETTFELVDIIKSCLSNKVLKEKGHPAKQVFQSLRIEVNDELNSLEEFLNKIPAILKKDGRVAIISFHSLEDRLIKNYFKKFSTVKDDKRIVIKQQDLIKPDFELLNKKIIISTTEELEINSRAKSAKLRGIKRVK